MSNFIVKPKRFMRWYNFFHIYQPPAWDEAIIRRVAGESYQPLLTILEQHPQVKITLNISGALTEQLIALGLGSVVNRLKSLIRRGQIELVGSAMYHPILPLLPIETVRHQIELQQQYHREIFGAGVKITGFYCPEMAYSPSLDNLLLELGYEWTILDEICGSGQLGKLRLDSHYVTPRGLRVVFRNRQVSDFLSFMADLSKPEECLKEITTNDRGGGNLVTGMDGEDLGHHRPGVEKLWEFLTTYPAVETSTISEFISRAPEKIIDPLAGSWSTRDIEVNDHIPFGLWDHPANPIHRLQWELTHEVIDLVSRYVSDPGHDSAQRLLDRALSSDRYWWASASPWWDMPIIIRETQRLADVIGPLEKLPGAKKNAVEKLMQQITTTVQLWERTGLAKKRQETYLYATGAVHFMAGRKI